MPNNDLLEQFAFDVHAYRQRYQKKYIIRDYRFVEPSDRKQIEKWLSAKPASKLLAYVIYSESLKPGEFLLTYEVNVCGNLYHVSHCVDVLRYDDWRKYIAWHLRTMRKEMKRGCDTTISVKTVKSKYSPVKPR